MNTTSFVEVNPQEFVSNNTNERFVAMWWSGKGYPVLTAKTVINE